MESREAAYFDDLEIMTPKIRGEYYDTKVREQVEYAYENAPAMRDKLDKAGIKPSQVRTVRDLEKIPVTSKDQLIELRRSNPPWGGVVAHPERVQKIYMSPGPNYEVQSLDDRFYRRYVKRLYAQGFRPGDIVVNTWSYHMVPAGHWFDEAIRRIGATVIPMGVGNTELQVQVLNDLKVTGWIGTSSFLDNILEKAEEMGFDVKRDFSLRSILAGGEMGGGPIRKMLEEKYGLIAYDGYGTAELGGVAYECPHRSGMHYADELFLEIVDPDTGAQLGPGEVGHVVVTPFDSTYPIIRFGTGDLAAYLAEGCPCGRTSFRLAKITGRVGDAVRTRGMFVHPRQVSDVVSRFPEISSAQCVVRRPKLRDELTLKIEVREGTVDREILEKKLEEVFPDVCRVRIDNIEFVPAGSIPKNAKMIIDERSY